MFFSKALLAATYKNGVPGKRTEEHERAEFHRFKTDYLFKDAKIPKDLYVARLIQHFVIIQAIEAQLQNLTDRTSISAFFALSYLGELWRTPRIHVDLIQLGVNPGQIDDREIAPTTKKYLEEIRQLPPKSLLSHFLTHVAGFMHGGNIIRKQYIEPSNNLTDYQISTKQYDFSSAGALLLEGRGSALAVYGDMMKRVDEITLEEDEYNEVLHQGKAVYATMTRIYDDLCDMHIKNSALSDEIKLDQDDLHEVLEQGTAVKETLEAVHADLCDIHAHQPSMSHYIIALVTVSMIAVAWILNSLSPIIGPTNSYGSGPK